MDPSDETVLGERRRGRQTENQYSGMKVGKTFLEERRGGDLGREKLEICMGGKREKVWTREEVANGARSVIKVSELGRKGGKEGGIRDEEKWAGEESWKSRNRGSEGKVQQLGRGETGSVGREDWEGPKSWREPKKGNVEEI